MQETTSPYATFAQRAYARLIDNALVSVPLTLLMLISLIYVRSLPIAMFFLLVEAAYKPLMESNKGWTFGKKLMKIKVVDQETGALMNLNQSLTRYIPWALMFFTSVFVYTRYFQDPLFAEVVDPETFMKFVPKHVLSDNFLVSLISNLSVFSAVWMFGDPLVRALHDRIAGTIVVRDLEAVEKAENVGWE